MDALKKEIEAVSSKKSVDSRMCELLLKVVEEMEKVSSAPVAPVAPTRGPRGEPGPRGEVGPQGPPGVCECKCKTVVARKKKATTDE